MKYDIDGLVLIELQDQCYTCEHFCKGVKCPLLEALAGKVVALQDEVYVSDCGFYAKFERRLKLVN